MSSHDAQVYQAVYKYRKAKSMQRQAGFLPIARKLDKRLIELEGKLTRANLALQQQHWVMFTALGAYLCRRQCFEAMCDGHRLPQVRAPARLIGRLSACCLVLCMPRCLISGHCTGVQACMHPCGSIQASILSRSHLHTPL